MRLAPTVPLLILVLSLLDPAPTHAAWLPGGTLLSPDPGERDGFTPLGVCTDDAGGAYVVWTSAFTIPGGDDTYTWIDVDRVDAFGNRPAGWSAAGASVLAYHANHFNGVSNVQRTWLLPDGAGGAIELQLETGFLVEPFEKLQGYAIAGGGTVQSEPSARASARAVALAPSGAGGTLMLFHPHNYSLPGDPPPPEPLTAARHDATGAPAWPGLELVPSGQHDTSGGFAVCSDGAGGMYAAWIDLRDAPGGTPDPDLYVQRIAADGTLAPGWPAGGVEVCAVAGAARAPMLVSDGAEGAIVVWSDPRSGVAKLYASHVLGTGAIDAAIPAGGREIAPGPDAESGHDLCTDGAGGAYVVRDVSAPAFRWWNRLHHLDAQGLPRAGWPADGRALGHVASYPGGSLIEPDGSGGVWVAFVELAGSALPAGSYATHLESDNSPAAGFSEDGYLLSATGARALLARTGLGAIAAWADFRSAKPAVYAQQLLPDGPVAVEIALVSSSVEANRVALEWFVSAGAAAFMTVERRSGDGAWETRGPAAPTGAERVAFEDLEVAPAMRYGYRLGWVEDGVAHTGGEVQVETPAPLALVLGPPRPNPVTGPLLVELALPVDAPATLEVLDLAGRRVAARDLSDLGAGRHAIPLDLGPAAAPGVYLLRLQQGAITRFTRFCVVH